MHLGRFLHEGYKVWEWRVNVAEKYLLHYTRGGMDIFEPTNEMARKWERMQEGCEAEILGLPCTVREGRANTVNVITVGGEPDPVTLPESFMDVLREWGNTWMWKSLRSVGDDDWLIDAIRDSRGHLCGGDRWILHSRVVSGPVLMCLSARVLQR